MQNPNNQHESLASQLGLEAMFAANSAQPGAARLISLRPNQTQPFQPQQPHPSQFQPQFNPLSNFPQPQFQGMQPQQQQPPQPQFVPQQQQPPQPQQSPQPQHFAQQQFHGIAPQGHYQQPQTLTHQFQQQQQATQFQQQPQQFFNQPPQPQQQPQQPPPQQPQPQPQQQPQPQPQQAPQPPPQQLSRTFPTGPAPMPATPQVGSEILVAFTKELATILYQNYIDPNHQDRTGYARFSRNYIVEANNQGDDLQHIVTDLGLSPLIQHLGSLYLRILDRASLSSLPQIEDFVSTALRFNAPRPHQQQQHHQHHQHHQQHQQQHHHQQHQQQHQHHQHHQQHHQHQQHQHSQTQPQASAPKKLLPSPLINSTPWAALVANGTLCMRHFFESVAVARQQQRPNSTSIDKSIETMLQERHELLCGHLLFTVADLSAHNGVQCRFCLTRYWWSWCRMKVMVLCPALNRSAFQDLQTMRVMEGMGEIEVEDTERCVWHSPHFKKCVSIEDFWECRKCGSIVEGLSDVCGVCAKAPRHLLVYAMPQNNKITSATTTATTTTTTTETTTTTTTETTTAPKTENDSTEPTQTSSDQNGTNNTSGDAESGKQQHEDEQQQQQQQQSLSTARDLLACFRVDHMGRKI